MKRALAIVLCAAIALQGCASARYASMGSMPQVTASPVDPATMAEFVKKLPAGAKVRVDTAAGRTVHGTLMKANDDEIVVQRNTRVPVAPDAIAIKDIARVVLETPGSNGKVMAVGAAIGAGAALGVLFLIAFLAFGDD